MTNKQHLASLKAARLYLDMRGYRILEQNWSQSKNKIDLIAIKNTIEFIAINYLPDNYNDPEITTAELSLKLKQATLIWLEENKYIKDYRTSLIEVYGHNYTILSFNQV